MPVEFLKIPKLVFLRLKAATKIEGLLEIKLNSRFIILIAGPIQLTDQLYEIGRAISNCLADDVN